MKKIFSPHLRLFIAVFAIFIVCFSILLYSFKIIASEYGITDEITALLLDQSQLVTHPGQGFGGADASAVVAPNTNNGFNANKAAFFWVADDIVVPAGFIWHIDSIRFYAYQGGTPPPNPSPILSCRVVILTGNNNNPDSTGSTVAYGDTNTNRMKRTAFANIYKVPSTNLLDVQRPVDIVIDTLNANLNAGTYWLKYNFNGSATYTGPWGPVRTILGQNNTGNAKQKVPGVGWINIIDTGTVSTKGMAYIIYGTQTPVSGIGKTGNEITSGYLLSQNYPNPFNPTTTIRYNIPNLSSPRILGGKRSSFSGANPVTLKVYDILGKEVETLVNENQAPGTYETVWDASKYSSGVYFYKLTTDGFSETRRMLMIK